MSGGAGHVLDAINRLRDNRSMRKSKKSKFKSNNQDLSFKTENEFKLKKVSDEKLQQVIAEIRINAKKEKQKDRIIFISITIVIIFLIYLFT